MPHQAADKAVSLLFRHEVAQILTSTPANLSNNSGNTTEVEILAQIQRIVGNGQQQSVQLCRAGDVTWVTKTDGDRQYFPVAGRASKRIHAPEDDEGAQQPEAVPTAAKPTAKKRKESAKKVAAKANNSSLASKTTTTKKRAARNAPGTGANYEGGALVEGNVDMRARVTDALRRGGRRAGTHSDEKSAVMVHLEEDLASLCGQIGGMDVESNVDAGLSLSDPQDLYC
ncbi:hypothetical protein P7C70_g8752, partial [Phenoliferia sp. Uapishka_3]